ncbi:hypothetical protein GPB2148_3666 [marine gamma proteobacterium HTCC2148]|nr:hypothetical protein GPB2148_3666 [marine gamma proteobacterium HTCC2148]
MSWLSFNARVLQEAADESVPIIERLSTWEYFPTTQMSFFGFEQQKCAG